MNEGDITLFGDSEPSEEYIKGYKQACADLKECINEVEWLIPAAQRVVFHSNNIQILNHLEEMQNDMG